MTIEEWKSLSETDKGKYYQLECWQYYAESVIDTKPTYSGTTFGEKSEEQNWA